jgi:hypothetical protein
MATTPSPAIALESCCPLCGTSILSISQAGRVEAEDFHPVPLFRTRRPGEAYLVCDECALLAGLPGGLTLN